MAYKQSPKSPALKALIGKQKNLPEALKQKILESGEKASMAKQTEGLRNISKEMKELTPEEKRKELAKKKAAQKRRKSTTGPKSKNIKITPKKGSGKPEKVDKKPIKKPIEGGIVAKPISEGAIKVKK